MNVDINRLNQNIGYINTYLNRKWEVMIQFPYLMIEFSLHNWHYLSLGPGSNRPTT